MTVRSSKSYSCSRTGKITGFTLIEIMIVVVIIGILGALILPNVVGRDDQARATAVQTDLQGLGNALELYKLDNFQYPSTDQGLAALISRPGGFPEPKNYNPGGYLRKKKEPVDPWKNPYVYVQGGSDYELYSLGADGTEGGEGINADVFYEDL
ncbi:MAG: type II secretion system major pseudopilin GspG [Pseudomonadales bacterium]|nr:type II secretion system major pseudopilin GspG [Pseudomonadales bacterium]